MMYEKRLERARKLQREQRGLDEEYHGEKLYEPSLEDELEKGDMFALVVSAIFTFLPIAIIALLGMILLACLFFRINLF